jgi:hypothetical protein
VEGLDGNGPAGEKREDSFEKSRAERIAWVAAAQGDPALMGTRMETPWGEDAMTGTCLRIRRDYGRRWRGTEAFAFEFEQERANIRQDGARVQMASAQKR